MTSSFVHPEFAVFYKERKYSATEFIGLEFNVDWLNSVQQCLRFWLAEDKKQLLVKTSGSTGKPKQIALSKSVIENSARATLSYFNLNAGDDILLFLPCKYIGGKMVVFRALIGGQHLHLFEPKSQLPELLFSYKFASLTPMQAANSISQLPKIENILLGGGAVHGQLAKKLQNISSLVYNSYGMTETASHVAIKRVGSKMDEPFKAVSAVRFSQDDRGCLIVHAAQLNVQSLVTNDVVKLLDDQTFYWKGRLDNVINSGGIKIFPEEIETYLEEQIKVPFFIASTNDEKLGEAVILYVESETEIKIDFSKLPKHSRPKQTIYLPRFIFTESNKINRTKTIELAQHG